ncbi:response regulator [Marispirochaeta sp.]|jgi:two-component system, chemotaxis family, chemotaxis protein CheY|uniref:response regulator n=1 Tax=Marispirochaeta sp. TaxID=2038653 RepID=UPI0029C62600|nr:response regulator [Marispirochaeta sp.]
MNGVLIVDDLEFMRTALREILEKTEIPVVGEACNGREGVEAFARLQPDVVLLDITMPEMDGLTALKRIRRKDPAARVVMCSALGQETTILKAIRYGARDFVVKPFKPERIVSAVRKALPGN